MDAIGMESLTFLGNIGGLALALLGAGLADGPVEVNCSFEAMLRLRREALEKPVAEILFGQGKA